MMAYNLSIAGVDGSIFGCISTDTNLLRRFLLRYDHEGSSLSLVSREAGNSAEEIEPEMIYKILRADRRLPPSDPHVLATALRAGMADPRLNLDDQWHGQHLALAAERAALFLERLTPSGDDGYTIPPAG